jgi:hypothetical protein
MKKDESVDKNKKRILGRILAKEISREQLKAAMGGASVIATANCADQSNCTEDPS